MSPLDVIGAVTGLAGIGGIVFAAGRIAESVKANTTATDKLSALLDAMAREFTDRFHDHDKRITVLEKMDEK